MKTDPVDDSAHPSGTHEVPGAADGRGAGETGSGEEDIADDGRNPTQRKAQDRRREAIRSAQARHPTNGRLRRERRRPGPN